MMSAQDATLIHVSRFIRIAGFLIGYALKFAMARADHIVRSRSVGMASIVALHLKKNAPELRLHRFGRIPYSSLFCPSDAIWDRLAMNTPIHSACRSWVSFSDSENFQKNSVVSNPRACRVTNEAASMIIPRHGDCNSRWWRKTKYGIFT